MLADEVALDLPMTAEAPALARRAIETLELGHSTREHASLLASELVSNAVRHSGADTGDSIELRASIGGGALRMSVTDRGFGFSPTARPPLPGVAGGFGLLLVARLAAAWGVEVDGRTTVWLELPLGRTQATG